MNIARYEKPRADHAFIGTWHIYEMEMWDEDYFNMEVQAYIAPDSRPEEPANAEMTPVQLLNEFAKGPLCTIVTKASGAPLNSVVGQQTA